MRGLQESHTRGLIVEQSSQNITKLFDRDVMVLIYKLSTSQNIYHQLIRQFAANVEHREVFFFTPPKISKEV